MPWADDAVLLVEGSVVADAAAAKTPGARGAGIAIHIDLTCRSIGEPWMGPAVPIDARGIPVLADAEEWPLEEDLGARSESGESAGRG
jgi:hypothetical protein